MGAGVSDQIGEEVEDWPLLKAQFAAITPENCMKVVEMQPREGEFRFEAADRFAAFAKANDLQLCGHCLVWAKDDRTPAWMFLDGDAPAGKEVLLARMKAHIDAVAGRYRGKVVSWDVVNEAIDDGAGEIRPSGWLGLAGEDFLVKAFEYAHAADPGAVLIYNDYNNELPGKREKMVGLLRRLLEKGAPIDAVGIQGHYQIDEVPFDDIEVTLKAMRELNLKVVVTELDIDVIPRGRWWADGGAQREELAKLNPYPGGLPLEIARRQAEQYGHLFRIFKANADVIERITFWNLHDGQSWLNDFPWKRVNHPLLFDRERKPKPAFASVMEALGAAPAP